MYKVAVIGAGVVGGLIARKLAEYDMSIVILERENDVAMGQSKANSGIVHAGYDPVPGTLKAKLNVKGSEMMEQICKELNVKYRRNGALVVGFDDEDEKNVNMLYERGLKNGVAGLKVLTGEEVRLLEKNLSKSIKSALYAPTSAVVCPYELTIHSVGNAMDNGAELLRNFDVDSIEKSGAGYFVTAADGRRIEAEYVINCAGLYSDKIAKLMGDESFDVMPRAGEYMLLDKEAGDLVETTIFRVPNEKGKGVLATKTVDGNILLGPTAFDRESKEDESVTPEGIAFVKEKEKEFFDSIPFDKVITEFTGLRSHTNKGDFIINSPAPNCINAAGIESPGLTSAPAIALMVEEMLLDLGLEAEKKSDFDPIRPKKDLHYGQVVCRCEEVTKAEIVDAIRTNPGARDVDGIKRRTRSGMGRCQGGFCLPIIVDILAEELGCPLEDVTKRGGKSNILYGRVKGEEPVKMDSQNTAAGNKKGGVL